MYIRTDQTFIDVIDDLLDTLGQDPCDLEDSGEQPAGLQLEIDGISFLIVHAPAADQEQFSVICKLGPLPAKREEAMQRVLELNTATALGKGAVFGMDPYDKVMTAILRMAVSEVDGASLLASLSMLVQVAGQWRLNALSGKKSPPPDFKKFPAIKGGR
ncbi:MAG: CesT family type III secretion system chaperone [Gammaproteobacteria bacterium]|nr:CesT family type III secretion system chaperone [Gammaproteobacteria bacterium]MBU1442678.1 CesT family type III secretion system chaperone [Gammaproteobacteria bacterium]